MLRTKTLASVSESIKDFSYFYHCFMASLDILCFNPFNLKNKIMKIEHKKIFRGPSKILNNISWPINICLKYFMAPTKTLWPPSYILNVQSLSQKNIQTKLKLKLKTKYYLLLLSENCLKIDSSNTRGRFKIPVIISDRAQMKNIEEFNNSHKSFILYTARLPGAVYVYLCKNICTRFHLRLHFNPLHGDIFKRM